MPSLEGNNNEQEETLFFCAILTSESASRPFMDSAIQNIYDQLNKKKKRHRYVAKVSPTNIAFESIDKAKKQYPIRLAEIIHIGRIPADPTVFSLQVQKEWNKKKKDKKDDGPCLLYLIRFEDSKAVDPFFNAINANKADPTAFVAEPSETGSLTEGQNSVSTRSVASEEGDAARTAIYEYSSVQTQNNAYEGSQYSYQDKMFGFSDSQSGMPRIQRSDSRRRDRQQIEKTGCTQSFVAYEPRPVGVYRVAPGRRSRQTAPMEVGSWPGRPCPRRKTSRPPRRKSSMSSASSECNPSSPPTPTYRDVDREREIVYRQDRRPEQRMARSYQSRLPDSLFDDSRMFPQLMDELKLKLKEKFVP